MTTTNEQEQIISRIKNGDDDAMAELRSIMKRGIELLLQRRGRGRAEVDEVFRAVFDAIECGSIPDLASAARFARQKIQAYAAVAITTDTAAAPQSLIEAVANLSPIDRTAMIRYAKGGNTRDGIAADLGLSRAYFDKLIVSLKVAKHREMRMRNAHARPALRAVS